MAKKLLDTLSDDLKKAKPKREDLSILTKVRNDPRFTQSRSIDWFKKKITELDGNSPSAKTDLLRTTKEDQTLRPLVGGLYLFKYDPLEESKRTMSAYDTWPLVICTNITDTGWYGINLHYLGYEMRRRLFDKIFLIAKNNIDNNQRCARLTWKLLGNVSKFPECVPAIKQYRYAGLQSRMIKIKFIDWVTAIHLPVESFAKKSFATVARASGQIVRKLVAGR